MLDNIRIVLINTYHPGNIGAAARAMKNMGLSQLYLVDPRVFPDEEADARAAGAKELLDSAVVVSTMDEAIADCQLVIGTSARNRTFDLPIFDAHDCAKKVVGEAVHGKVAIVFGRETMGLHNSELQKCNFHVYIPANPEYPVLNVSAAIQLVCYEIWQAHEKNDYVDQEQPYPLIRDIELFYEHLESALRKTRFIIPQHEGKVMEKLRRYFNRSRPERTELNMLRGILTSIDETVTRISTHSESVEKQQNKGSDQ